MTSFLLHLDLMAQSWVEKVPEYPHPVKLGVLTMAAAAAGFLASTVFVVTGFDFSVTLYVVWPMAKPFLKLLFGLVFGILARVWENFADIVS
ncbi:unnamed protein product [Ilex paraguariensis]|uniref:Uncharacterized protein n=1 Tax=Ilex paraguariensis TaxID=185542 RepID=A0ABC8RU29_9AQUA